MAKIYTKPVDKGELKVFKLVAGHHIGVDFTQEPTEVLNADREVVGYTYPSKQFDAADPANCYVLSPDDLLKTCVNKFAAEPNWSEAHKMLDRQAKAKAAAEETPKTDT